MGQIQISAPGKLEENFLQGKENTQNYSLKKGGRSNDPCPLEVMKLKLDGCYLGNPGQLGGVISTNESIIV